MSRLKLSRVCGVIALSLIQAPAIGADKAIDGNTSCAAVRQILDAAEPDQAKTREIFKTVQHVFVILDAKNEAQGRAKIYDRMSKDGKFNTIAVVTARCDNHPTDTLEISAVTIYGTFEAMGDTMGLNGPDK